MCTKSRITGVTQAQAVNFIFGVYFQKFKVNSGDGNVPTCLFAALPMCGKTHVASTFLVAVFLNFVCLTCILTTRNSGFSQNQNILLPSAQLVQCCCLKLSVVTLAGEGYGSVRSELLNHVTHQCAMLRALSLAKRNRA
jgi:hypothetical protein